MDKKKYVRVDPFTGFPEKDVKEDAPTTSTAGVAATGDDPTVVVRKKKKLYDGRTRIARKFIERILKQRESRRLTKEEVELDEVLKPKDKKVIDDFVQMNKGTGAQNFTQRGSIVDYEGRSLEKKGGMGAQQIASLESDPKDDYKIKVHAKMDSRSTQSIVNYLKKSAKKYNIKVEETVKEEIMTDEDFRGYGKHFALTLTPTLRKKVMKLLDKEKIEYDKFSRKFLFIGKDGGKAPISMKDQKSILSKIEKEIGKDNFNYTFQKEEVEFDDLEEAVANLFVKGDNPNQMALKIAKNAKGLGLKSAMMGNQVRVKGSQKQVNDFMRSVLGKSSMGSPTEKGASNPQIDKMLNKQLKEDVFRSNDFVGKIIEKVNDFGNEHELVETNLKVLQNIVKKKQNQKVKFKDKQATVDLFTASAIMKVYDAVKPDNKKKIEKLMNGTLVDFLKLQKFAMKQVKFA